jgi:small subunit ribosomal protein S6
MYQLMMRYEVLMLTIPEITEDEARTIETQLDNTLKTVKGTVISFERWGKYRLAYPINKNEYGVYFLARFEIDKDSAKILDEVHNTLSVKLHELIMRSMVSRLDMKQSLVYQRPPSLEEAPKREGFFDRHDDERGPRSPSAYAAQAEIPVVEDELDDDVEEFTEA